MKELQKDSNHWLKIAGNYLALSLIIAPFILLYVFLRLYQVDVPVRDDWYFIPLLKDAMDHKLTFAELFDWQHNDHKVFVPYAIALFFALLTHYDTYILSLVNCVLYLIAGVLLLIVARNCLSNKNLNVNIALLPVAWAFLGWRNHEMLLSDNASINHICQILFLLLTLLLISQATNCSLKFFMGIVSAACCSYSNIAGLLVWLFGFMQICALRIFALIKSGKDFGSMLLLWSLSGCFVFYGVLSHYSRPKLVDTNHISTLWADMLQYYLACVGSAISAQPQLAIWCGLALIGLAGYLAINVITGNTVFSYNCLVPAIMMAFALITDAMITWGRYPIGIGSAVYSRFATTDLFLLYGLYLFVLSSEYKSIVEKRVFVGIVLGFYAFGIYDGFREGMYWGPVVRDDKTIAANRLTSYAIQSSKDLNIVVPDMEQLHKFAPFLEQNYLTVFAKPRLSAGHLPKTYNRANYAINSVNGQSADCTKQPFTAEICSVTDETLCITGYAFDADKKTACGGVILNIDGLMDFVAAYPLNNDVENQNSEKFIPSRTGFLITLKSSILKSGWHTIRLELISPDKKSVYATGNLVKILVQ